MALNSTGPLSIGGSTVGQSINLELGRAASATSSMGETALRNLAGVPSGAISMSNFYGKSAFTPGSQTFTANGTFVVPTGTTTLTIEAWGAGGEGGAAATTTGAAGTASIVSGTGLTTMTAGGGSGGTGGQSNATAAGGAGGTATGGNNTNTTGNAGGTGNISQSGVGGTGGNGITGSITGGTGGAGGVAIPGAGPQDGSAGTAPGAGGGGGGIENTVMCVTTIRGGGGGGGGAYVKTITTAVTPGTTLTVTVGIGGNNLGSGNGADGRVIIAWA